jgi:phospholipid transport system substrate-binding protein
MREVRALAIERRLTIVTWTRAVALLAGAFLVALLALPAHAAPTPKEFVQQAVDEGVSILGDESLSDSDRRARFREFMLGLVEERRIALFTLGSYRGQASEAEIDEFVDSFTEYAIAVYESRLSQYKGQTLKVTDVTERSEDDFIVTTVVEGDTGGGEPVSVAFRLRKESDEFTVVDIQVVGIWLAIDQQGQFASFLRQNNGSVPALTAHLRDRTERIRAGEATE